MPLEAKADQYIHIRLPALGLSSFLWTHPFVVTSWAAGKTKELRLLIKPRQGILRTLCDPAGFARCQMLLSGTHGESAAFDEYEKILMVASGFGVAAHLPDLKRLIW